MKIASIDNFKVQSYSNKHVSQDKGRDVHFLSNPLSSQSDYYNKVIKSKDNNNGILIASILGVSMIGASFIAAKSIKGGNNRGIQKMKRIFTECQFQNLSHKPEIPTIDNCKGLSEEMEKYLRFRVNYANAPKEIKEKLGKRTDENSLLLIGNPGTGKSFFGKILAKTLGADFMEIKFSDYNSSIIGEDIERMQHLFEDVLKTTSENPEKPYVLVFNEIDAVLQPMEKLSNMSARSSHLMYKIEERGTWLQYFEKMMERPNLTIIGTTNQRDVDLASKSRFKHVYEVNYPTADVLYEVMRFKLSQFEYGRNILPQEKELKEIAQKMSDRICSFRDLEKILGRSTDSYMDEYLKDNSKQYTIDYIKNSLESVQKTDGELAINKRNTRSQV